MPKVQINGQGLHYEDSGGEGPVIMMLHGFLFDQSMFDGLVASLSPRYRCVRFDARSFGQTEWDGKPYDLYDTAADCIGLMDHLGIDKAVVMGMSQGGYAAIRIAVKYPERVQGLVFISTYNGVDTDDVKSIYRSMRDTWMRQGPEPLMPTFLGLFLGPQEKAGDLWKVWEPKWSARTGADIEAAMNNLIDRDEVTAEQVQQITVPVMGIHGIEDQGIPMALGEALFESMPNGKQMLRVPGATHGAAITHAEVIAPALLTFLDEVTKSDSQTAST